MAARIVLLLLLFCEGGRNGISEAVVSSKVQPHPESIHNFIESFKEPASQRQDGEDDVRTLPNVAFRLNDRRTNDFDFKDNIAATVQLKHPAKPRTPNHSPELTPKRSNLTNGEVEGVINAHRQVASSGEEHALQLHLETAVGGVLPERTRGRSKRVGESEDGRSESNLPRSRLRRSWLWNQFFVIEEYRGPEPVLIGRVCKASCDSPVVLFVHHRDIFLQACEIYFVEKELFPSIYRPGSIFI